MLVDGLRLDGRAVLVAGAAGKISSVVCRELAGAGARLVLVDRDTGALDALLPTLEGGPHRRVVADVCDASSLAPALDDALDGRALRGAVSMVGGVERDEFAPLLAGGATTYDAILDRNLRSAATVHHVAAAAMVAGGQGGSIVAISAATALASSPFHAYYGAAKAAVVALARTEAVEWGRHGIRVNTVAPGGVETAPPADPEAMARAARAAVPLGRRARPLDIAGAVLFLLSDLASYITGHTLVLDGGGLAKPAFLDAEDVPVFVSDPALRERMRGA
jgi:NAD(P)-dependent dehydrogenase (short-subunit alcohol dehydrogenase family)